MILIFDKYSFLFALALVWIIAACVKDIRSREVPNWLNFSLVSFAIAYRVLYSSFSGEWNFVLFGVLGFVLFLGLGNLFYYTRVFAGGDAKLLMALGLILPFESFGDLVLLSGIFIVLLFGLGSVYTLIYSVFIVIGQRRKFVKEFRDNMKKYMIWLLVGSVLFGVLIFFVSDLSFSIVAFVLFLFMSLVYLYVKSIDVCMIKLVDGRELTEGDWLVDDVRLGKRVIKKTVHGLTLEDIRAIRKYGKKIYIKEGVPFVPAFLVAFGVMVFFLVTGLLSNLLLQLVVLFS